MEDLPTEASVAPAPVRAKPHEPVAGAELLAARIERAVQQETSRGVRNLSVEVSREGVLLKGFCSTYYCKQLAQHAAMSISGSAAVINSIEVS